MTRLLVALKLLLRTHFSGSATPLPSFLSFRAMHGVSVPRVEAAQQQFTKLHRMFKIFLTIDSEDWSMGGMTTVTLTDHWIDRLIDNILEPGSLQGMAATRPGVLKGWGIA